MDHEEQERRRQWFRHHLEHEVPYNVHVGVGIESWSPEAVVLALPFADHLSAHERMFHGGVVSALIDTAGVAAVMAGHDYGKGSRASTVALAVQYLAVAPGEDLRAEATCPRRGSTVHFAEVTVRSSATDRLLAQGLVTVLVASERAGIEGRVTV